MVDVTSGSICRAWREVSAAPSTTLQPPPPPNTHLDNNMLKERLARKEHDEHDQTSRVEVGGGAQAADSQARVGIGHHVLSLLQLAALPHR